MSQDAFNFTFSPPNTARWQPLSKLPDLSMFDKLALDTETTGLNVWAGHRPGGVSIALPNGKAHYLPWGHAEGTQFDKRDVHEWLRREIRGKEVRLHHGRFDLLQLWADGVDLREQGNTFRDTMLSGPLLDEFQKFGLDAMGKRYVGRGKEILPFPASDMMRVPSWAAATYAENDAKLTWDLHEAHEPLLRAEDLNRVYDLECRVLPAIVEMEINGLRLDVPTLERWGAEIRNEEAASIRAIGGINPDASSDLIQLFNRNGWAFPFNRKCENCEEEWPEIERAGLLCPACGKNQVKKMSPHFGQGFLKSCGYPVAKDIVLARKLRHILSNYIAPWEECANRDGMLRYVLHQLRNDEEHGTYGTISGRFSASAIFGGAHPQQIWKVDKQIAAIGDKHILRKLFIAGDGMLFGASDASQIEFRIFGHYSQAPLIIDAYRENPHSDFHQLVASKVLMDVLPRTPAKSINFLKLYGGGPKKMAREMNIPLADAQEMSRKYDEMFPEAKEVTSKASRLAKERGYVKTIYGRRARFKTGMPLHMAFNRVDQGTAADVMKERLAVVYENRKQLEILMRLTVHDELVYDTPSKEKADQVTKVLDDFSIPMRVPLLWGTDVGHNWAMR